MHPIIHEQAQSVSLKTLGRIFAIGDIQGCADAFNRLLSALHEQAAFDPTQDRLWIVGDILNRGTQSLAVARQLMTMQAYTTIVLGNHDLHFLACVAGVRQPSKSDTFQDILNAPDCDIIVDWLRHLPLLHYDTERNWLMVHAGVIPQWSLTTLLDLHEEVIASLHHDNWRHHLGLLYGNTPNQWSNHLARWERQRFVVNTLTRIRFCTAQGQLDFHAKGGLESCPTGFAPWFSHANRQTNEQRIVFGHWSALGLRNEDRLIACDTGYAWGGSLTAISLEDGVSQRKIIEIIN
jgi:bis(5'-nucleosyl)-tetraphosphatase (symmetrical)